MKVFWLISVLLIGLQGFAQEATITGSVQDKANGETLPGVTVLLKGTTTGTVTSITGDFNLKAKVGDVLVISCIGYASQEIAVASAAPLKISLSAEAIGLNDVVVIGYGQVKKSDATGALTTVSSKDFNKGSITSPQDLLVGKSAGVVITSSGGAPGAGSQIRVRGGSSLTASNDPLIVIDGVPQDNTSIAGLANPLSTINPNDIESFTVLKDASATAIYGSRASNGVIIITTKRGSATGGMKVQYSGNVSVSTVPAFVDVLSASELKTLANERLGSNNIDAAAVAKLGASNTDWQKEIYSNAISHDHNLSVSGAQFKTPYRVSVGYTDQNGILKNTSLNRYTASIGLDPKFLNDNLKVNINAKGSVTENSFGETGAVGAANSFDPTQPVKNGNTNYGGYTTWTTNGTPNGAYNQMATTNPLAMADLTDNKSTVNRGTGNIQLDYKMPFLPDLRANLNTSIDIYSSEGHNNADTTLVSTRRSGYGRNQKYTQDGYTQLLDFYLNYVKDLEGIASKIDLTGGYSWQKNRMEHTNIQQSIVAPGHPLVTADDSKSATVNYLVSFFARMNYTLKNRYLLTATLRDDGSSRFAKDNRWGLFPSVALAWKLNEESFLANIDALNELKVRVGWGQTGQQDLGQSDFPYLGTYRSSQPSASYQFGNTWVSTLRPNAYDPKIKWETTTTQNIALDYGFFNGRISGSIDVYKRVTDDLLSNITIPNGSNFSNTLTTNVGSLENKGFEFSISVRPISTQKSNLNIGFNLAYNENKITKLLRTDDPNYLGIQTGGISGGTGNNIQVNSVGYAINSFFVLQQVYDSNGSPIEGVYVDRSGKGGNVAGSLSNYYRYKSPSAPYTMGLNARYTYKSFDFSFSGRLNIGNYVYNNAASNAFYANLYNNNFWQNLNASVKETKFSNSQYFSDYYVENASFFRMDNISAGYSFDKIFTDKLRGHLNFTVQNAFVITKYSGLDPEVTNGIDNNLYPRPRTFLLGLTLDL